MDEATARQVMLLRTLETTGDSALWTAQDRAWASEQAVARVGSQAALGDFVAARAQAAWQRLAPRDAALQRWPAPQAGWRMAGGALAVAALLLGLFSHGLDGSQTINLLAPPVWALLLWNAGVYAALLLRALRPTAGAGTAAASWLARVWQRLGTRWPAPAAAASGTAWPQLLARWSQLSMPLTAQRATACAHAAAALLALGMLAGLYLRGLVWDYRAAWQSTFLAADTVHALLSIALAPASAVSGVSVPDAAGIAALRVGPGLGGTGGPAAPWIHLYATWLLLGAVLPRASMALWAAWRARRLAADFALPLQEPYFQALGRTQRMQSAALQLLPYAQTPTAQAVLNLRSLLARICGEGLKLEVADTVAFGDEDQPLPTLPSGWQRLACFELSATPEAEHQGRWLQRLAQQGSVLALVDEAGFQNRFASQPQRLEDRRKAWRELARAVGCELVFVHLGQDGPDGEAALRVALGA